MFEKTISRTEMSHHSFQSSIMECVIGYIRIFCAGTAARGARLKLKNCGLTMMLFTHSYKNHSRVYSRPYLTSVEVSKHYSNH